MKAFFYNEYSKTLCYHLYKILDIYIRRKKVYLGQT